MVTAVTATVAPCATGTSASVPVIVPPGQVQVAAAPDERRTRALVGVLGSTSTRYAASLEVVRTVTGVPLAPAVTGVALRLTVMVRVVTTGPPPTAVRATTTEIDPAGGVVTGARSSSVRTPLTVIDTS
ncbi:MAG: hypothetical protein BWY91_03240 [bacterium ADurb.BinA028]|nr:MAG: hypothetical protein BWY91_03240 [bacterium ADurb.BinA028]